MSDPQLTLNDDPQTQFNPDHPPLLSVCGFGKIALLQTSGYVEEVSKTRKINPLLLLDLNLSTPNAVINATAGHAPPNVTATPDIAVVIKARRYWRQYKPTMHLEAPLTIVDSLSFSSSVSQLQSMRAAVSATVGGTFGPVTAEVSAELETATQLQTDVSSTTAQERTIALEGGKTYAFWELVSEISIATTEDWHGTVVVKFNNLSVSATMFKAEGTHVGPGTVFAVAGATFQDSVTTSTLRP